LDALFLSTADCADNAELTLPPLRHTLAPTMQAGLASSIERLAGQEEQTFNCAEDFH
jgi:hypothetical protein